MKSSKLQHPSSRENSSFKKGTTILKAVVSMAFAIPTIGMIAGACFQLLIFGWHIGAWLMRWLNR